jgi:hypothetical protein
MATRAAASSTMRITLRVGIDQFHQMPGCAARILDAAPLRHIPLLVGLIILSCMFKSMPESTLRFLLV